MLGDFTPEAYNNLRELYPQDLESLTENEIYESEILGGEIHTETSGLRAKYFDVIESEISDLNEG